MALGFDTLFTQAWAHCDNKPQQIRFNHDNTQHFQFPLLNAIIFH